MPVVVWDSAGLPHSSHYTDIYRSASAGVDQGLAQAQQVFLAGCQLLDDGEPSLWQGQPHWCVLENGFGLGLNFLATWQTWRNTSQRPQRLHYVATESHPVSAADLLRSSRPWPELQAFTRALSDQWWGLLPGIHRLSFEAGAVVLDLAVGDSLLALQQLQLQADSVYLDGFDPRCNPDMWSSPVLSELARLSRPGARWATWCVAGEVTSKLAALGLEIGKRPGLAPKRECLQAVWRGRPLAPLPLPLPLPLPATTASGDRQSVVCVLGAGLAGASVARSLAERGRTVQVIDAQGPAAGASGLPAGVFSAHTSGADQALARLTRMGLRHTLARLGQLERGIDWDSSGLDEQLLDRRAHRQPPSDAALCRLWYKNAIDLDRWRQDWWQMQPLGWCQPHAGWVQPKPLIQKLLDHPLIETVFGWRIAQMQSRPSGWHLIDDRQRSLSVGHELVLALGSASNSLLNDLGLHLPIQAVRGQISLGSVPQPKPGSWPTRPCNGDGSLLPELPIGGVNTWLIGASFDRSRDHALYLKADQQRDALRWQRMHPDCAAHLPPLSQWQAWSGVRATTRDRLPCLGLLPVTHDNRLSLICGLGARGLTLAGLCGEQVAATLCDTPMALPASLRQALRHDREG